jgi:hypothetical protein
MERDALRTQTRLTAECIRYVHVYAGDKVLKSCSATASGRCMDLVFSFCFVVFFFLIFLDLG